MRLHLAVAVLVLPSLLHAQHPDSMVTLTGRVVDATDSGGIAQAILTVAGSDIHARSDGWGYYTLRGVRRGAREIVVQALGYAKLTQSVDVLLPGKLNDDFFMMRVPHVLTQMVIEGRSMRVPRGFEEVYRRGALGFGYLITREQIDSINPMDLKTMLDMLPGVRTNDRGVYFPMCSLPQLWVDGTNMTRMDRTVSDYTNTINDFLHYMAPNEVQAMEVYKSHVTVPAEFLTGNPCGVIAIWTKRGP